MRAVLTASARHACAQSLWATFLMALAGFFLALHKERFAKFGYGFNVALLTFPIVAIPGVPTVTIVYMAR